jgi:hypothetical protein
MLITTIEHPIKQIHQANLVTLGKYKPLDKIDWKKVDLKGLLLSEHSTIEWSPLYIFEITRKDVTSHLVRHTKQHPRFSVQSGRPDWTGKERPPYDAPSQFMIEANPLSLISMARQRLCFKAMKETRAWMENVTHFLLKAYQLDADTEASAVTEETTSFYQTLGQALVPDCVYRGCCCQRKGCTRYDTLWSATTLQERYQKYTQWLITTPRESRTIL